MTFVTGPRCFLSLIASRIVMNPTRPRITHECLVRWIDLSVSRRNGI